jgi:tRNA uridine 5-carbamoylmethylation protein Kti12
MKNSQHDFKKALVVNIMGGPGCGKSVTAAQLFVDLKKQTHFKIEYFQEYVKPLVWKAEDPNHRERAEEAIEELNNQRSISNHIYQLLKIMASQLDIIVTDGSLFHGVYYNLANKNNTSDVQKTQDFIIEKFAEFDNYNIYLERGDIEYEQEGRQQTYEEALIADDGMLKLIKQFNVPFKTIRADSRLAYEKMLDDIISYVLSVNADSM